MMGNIDSLFYEKTELTRLICTPLSCRRYGTLVRVDLGKAPVM